MNRYFTKQRQINDKNAHEKMPNIISQQGNINHNHSEMLFKLQLVPWKRPWVGLRDTGAGSILTPYAQKLVHYFFLVLYHRILIRAVVSRAMRIFWLSHTNIFSLDELTEETLWLFTYELENNRQNPGKKEGS